jgi:hypothetical protein
MSEPDKVEQLVSGHLQRTLESQRGRAVAAFREQMKAGGVAGEPLSFEEERRRSVRALRMWAGAASLMAACLAVVVTLQFVRHQGGGTETGNVNSGQSVAAQPVSVPMMDQVELSRELDGGTRLLQDQTPVRVVRQQRLLQKQWFDPNEKATYRVTQPVEQVGYVRIQPY